MNIAEERATALLDALDVAGFPDDHDHERLVEYLSTWNEIRVARGRRVGACIHYPDGGGRVVVPLLASPRLLNEAIARSLGHLLLNTGLGSLLASFDAPVAHRVQLKDESLALRFALAWELPVEALLPLLEEGAADGEIAETARCTPALIAARRAQLAEPGSLPERRDGRTRWCAAREYALRWRPLPHTDADGGLRVRHCFQIVARGNGLPRFELDLGATATQSELEYARFRLEADLRALTVRELELKYANRRPGPEAAALLLDPWEARPAPATTRGLPASGAGRTVAGWRGPPLAAAPPSAAPG